MSRRTDRRSGGHWSLLGFLALGLMLFSTTGCRRGFYRRQADREVYGLVDCAASETGMAPGEFTIEPDPQSRLFDPNCPDRPPMPPDDPTSHQLMHCVDCKPGSPCWHLYGETPYVENPEWMIYLPRDEQGQVVIDRPGAMRLALQNSREYQRELEDLYLSALDVTFERFRLDAQFFGGNSTFFTADGPARAGGPSSLLTVDNDLQMRKLFAGGGELVVGMANSLVWQFAGPDAYAANTLLDFSLVQPLLRGSGRAVVLERLTDSERALLANIRQMERFQRGFYTQIVAGRGPGSGPSRGGPGIDTGSIRGGGGAGGYLGLLEDRVLISNQKANMLDLRENLELLEELHMAGRVTATQVGLTRQSLYSAQSRLIRITADYQAALDAYKITLGLPPQLDIRIEDDLLARFDLIDPALSDLQDEMTLLLGRFSELTDATSAQAVQPLKDPAETTAFYQSTDRLDETAEGPSDTPGDETAPEELPDDTNTFDAIGQAAMAQLEVVVLDLQSLDEATDERRENLTRLSAREEFRRGDIDPRIGDADAFLARVDELHKEFSLLSEQMRTTWSQIEPTRQAALAKASTAGGDPMAAIEAAESHQRFKDLMAGLSTQLNELSVIQARARLDTVTLAPSQLTADDALETARENRRDWRNARAALVDQWRQIKVVANDLESGLDVTFSGDINTTDNNPVRFRGTTGRLRVGLEFDAPLTRLEERNAYRETLIAYQQARRQFYSFEDLVAAQLRDTIRTIRRNQLNFEVQRAAVFVAITRVDQAQEKLREPKKAIGTMKLGDSAARDLVTALAGLLDAQNAFLNVWVDQEVQRLNLDFDLGTMQLDQNGMWIDPTP